MTDYYDRHSENFDSGNCVKLYYRATYLLRSFLNVGLNIIRKFQRDLNNLEYRKILLKTNNQKYTDLRRNYWYIRNDFILK